MTAGLHRAYIYAIGLTPPSGEPDRDRTCDPLIKSQMLYQLSYGPLLWDVRKNRDVPLLNQHLFRATVMWAFEIIVGSVQGRPIL